MSSSKLRLAQIFSVGGSYIPTKASIYLKRIGNNINSYFDLSSSSVVIDSPNFSSILQKEHKVLLDDRYSGFTGSGYMTVADFGSGTNDSTFPIIKYPIISSSEDLYNIWLRVRSTSATANVDLFLDNDRVDQISSVVVANNWVWIYGSFVVTNNQQKLLGIRLKENNLSLDKIYIDQSYIVPAGFGPTYTEYPFITVHMQLYDTASNSEPTIPLLIYDYKNSIDHVILDDWYNFDTTNLDAGNFVSFNNDFYALVLSTSGGSSNNSILWEVIESSEYDSTPSAIKV